MKYYHESERDENSAVESARFAYKLESESSRYSKFQQKKARKSEYSAKSSATKSTVKSADKAKKGANLVRKGKKGVIIALALVGCVAIFMSVIGSCSMLVQGGLGALGMTTYPSKKSEMLKVEAAYCELEADLQEQIDDFEADHPGYDEYQISGSLLGHNPYVLTSLLSAKYGEYSLASVELEAIFEAQYTLHRTVVSETRYRTETRIGYDEATETEYTYEVDVPYDYRIYKVTLEQFDLETIVSQFLTADEITQYNVFMTTKGNYPDLF